MIIHFWIGLNKQKHLLLMVGSREKDIWQNNVFEGQNDFINIIIIITIMITYSWRCTWYKRQFHEL